MVVIIILHQELVHLLVVVVQILHQEFVHLLVVVSRTKFVVTIVLLLGEVPTLHYLQDIVPLLVVVDKIQFAVVVTSQQLWEVAEIPLVDL